MGTAKQNRVKGVGEQLLQCSLHSMKQEGYEYAIIGQAGPVGFIMKKMWDCSDFY
ncbi:hypothetical protein IEI_03359 [Bacillus wiedmannii]|nr:hypothetical protein IEI_03359 [Bacillus wiedmannii]